MDVIYNGQAISFYWRINRNASDIPEDFTKADLKVFFIGNDYAGNYDGKYYFTPIDINCDPDSEQAGDYVHIDIDAETLPPGTYCVEAVWIKNRHELLNAGSTRTLTRARKDRVFKVADYEPEASDYSESDSTMESEPHKVIITSGTTSYGYDGMSAYETAVFEGSTVMSEKEWIEKYENAEDRINYEMEEDTPGTWANAEKIRKENEGIGDDPEDCADGSRRKNEYVRQQNESARQAAETERQTTFETNEGSRETSTPNDGSRWGDYKQAELDRGTSYVNAEGTNASPASNNNRWGQYRTAENSRQEAYTNAEGTSSDEPQASNRWGAYKRAEGSLEDSGKGDSDRWGQYKEQEGTPESTSDDSRWAEYNSAEDDRDTAYATAEGAATDAASATGSRWARYNKAEVDRETAYDTAEGEATDASSATGSRWARFNKAQDDRDTAYSTAEAARTAAMGPIMGYYSCATAASTAAKEVSATNYVLTNGGSIKVKFTYANSASSPTLNINSTGAKAIVYNGAVASATNTWAAGDVVEFYYDPTYNSNAGAFVGIPTVVSVSQNTETGHTDITIGEITTPVPSVEEVGQIDQKIEHKLSATKGTTIAIFPFDIKEGHRYQFINESGVAVTLSTADENGDIIEIIGQQIDTSIVFIANQDAPNIRLGDTSSDVTFSLIELSTLTETTKQLVTDTDKLFSHVGIPQYAVRKDSFIKGYWYNDNGHVAFLENHATLSRIEKYIPVKENDILRTELFFSSAAIAILFADDNNTVISSISSVDLEPKTIVPSGTTRVYVNTLTARLDDSYCFVNVPFIDVVEESLYNLETFNFVDAASKKINNTAVNGNTGELVQANGLVAVSLNLENTQIKKIRYVVTESTYYGYGFVVNGVWQGVITNAINIDFPTGLSYKLIEINVPDGASEFRCCWNTNVYAQENPIMVYASNALSEAYNNSKPVKYIQKAVLKDINIPILPYLGDGGILINGDYDTNTAFGHYSMSLANKTIVSLTFKETFVNNNTRRCYGFIINGNWVGYEGLPVEETDTYKIISVNVPEGATEFRCNWNRNIVSDSDFTLVAYGNIPYKTEDKLVFQFEPDFNLNRVPNTIVCPTEQEAHALTLAQLYAKYDELVSLYPDYITKVNCDSEVQSALSISAPEELNGLPIYMYKFVPLIGGDNQGVENINRPKVLITSMHPQERLGVIATFEMMKMIVTNWANDINAEQLTSLVDIYVLPVPWPWNFKNISRVNYNGVNGNRQFPTRRWKEAGQGTLDYTGPSPLSEYEAKVINYYFLQISPNVVLDVHTSGNDDMGHMGVLLVNEFDTELIDLCGIIAKTTSNVVSVSNPNYPTSMGKCLYGVYPEDGSAKGEFYEYCYEMNCKYSILSEQSPYSKWNNKVFDIDSPIIEQYTNDILRGQVQYLFNIILRLTKATSV